MSVIINYNYTPQFTQKKRNLKNTANTYRVLFEDAYNWKSRPETVTQKIPDYFTPIPQKIPETQSTLYPKRDLRHHNPQPQHCQFLLNNARTLNDPQCYVKTLQNGINNENNWFYDASLQTQKLEPKYTTDTISRSDYLDWKSDVINTRHSRNPYLKMEHDNILSHNHSIENKTRFWNEGLSFEHQYNSRVDPNYPERSKRHGAFVWSRNYSHKLNNGSIEKDETIQKSMVESQKEFQHKLACNRQFAESRYLQSNIDSVSRLIRPDVDNVGCKEHSETVFTH